MYRSDSFAKHLAIFFLTLSIGPFAQAALQDGSCGQTPATTTTSHKITIGGVVISYQATVGFLEADSKDKTSRACIFYTAYTVPSKKPRPLTFAFNGGPGSASVWLHLGFLGPQRVDMGTDGTQEPALDAALIPNEYSPLDVTDVVMIDPVATGFSHPIPTPTNSSANGATPPDNASKFFGAKNDYASIASFIRNYLNANSRWLSPKFIVGESYGGVRGALLARYLQSDMLIGVDGVFFISPAFSWTSLDFSVPNNLAPYWAFLPNYAVTAWYLKTIHSQYQALSVDDVYKTAKKFADSIYREALIRGSNLSETDFNTVAAMVSELTGVGVNRVKELGLKIRDSDYFESMGAQYVIGRLDSRFVGLRSGDPEEKWPTDPGISILQYAYTAGINDYLRNELQYQNTSTYNIFGDIKEWPFDSDGVFFNVLNDLSHALADNPKLRIKIASGYFDLGCPTGAVEYDLSQLPHGKLFASRISVDRYFGGHMMYTNPAALKTLKANFASFVQGSPLTNTPVVH